MQSVSETTHIDRFPDPTPHGDSLSKCIHIKILSLSPSNLGDLAINHDVNCVSPGAQTHAQSSRRGSEVALLASP